MQLLRPGPAHSAPTRPWWCVVLALALAALPCPRAHAAHAAPAASAKEPPLPDQARELYQKALDSRAQNNHATAARLFKAAYRELGPPGQPSQWPNARGALTANIYDELLAAFNEHGRIEHLCSLHEHLTAYREEALPAAQAKRVTEMLVELERTVAATTDRQSTLESACAPTAPPSTPPAAAPTDPGAPPTAAPEAAPPAAPIEPPGGDIERRRQHLALTASGVAAVLVGVGGLAVMTGAAAQGRRINQATEDKLQEVLEQMRDLTAAERADTEERHRQGLRYNKIALAAGISGGVLVAVGAGLLIAGARRKPRLVSVLPSLSPVGGGVSLQLRF